MKNKLEFIILIIMQYLFDLCYSLVQLILLWILFITLLGFYRNCIRPPYNLKKRYTQSNSPVWACVTGGTDGLGLAYCKVLARCGFNIVILSRNP